jgi:uncharacterized phage-associated protein
MEVIKPEKLDEKRYKNAVLYFIKYCNNRFLHATKLNKLFYYLDFVSYRDTGKPVTGDIYIHEKYGPVPASLDKILATLKAEKLIDTKAGSYKDGEITNFILTDEKQIDESVFSSDQKTLLKQICDEFGSWPTDKIVAQTHLEAPWFYSKPWDVVDYKYSKDIEVFRQ